MHFIYLSILALTGACILKLSGFKGTGIYSSNVRYSWRLCLTLLAIIIGEELLFRDYLMIKLQDYEHKYVLNGILFGLIHIPNIIMIGPKRIQKILYIIIIIPTLSYAGYVFALQDSLMKA